MLTKSHASCFRQTRYSTLQSTIVFAVDEMHVRGNIADLNLICLCSSGLTWGVKRADCICGIGLLYLGIASLGFGNYCQTCVILPFVIRQLPRNDIVMAGLTGTIRRYCEECKDDRINNPRVEPLGRYPMRKLLIELRSFYLNTKRNGRNTQHTVERNPIFALPFGSFSQTKFPDLHRCPEHRAHSLPTELVS